MHATSPETVSMRQGWTVCHQVKSRYVCKSMKAN